MVVDTVRGIGTWRRAPSVRSSLARRAVGVLLALAVAGCGSTLPPSERAAAGSRDTTVGSGLDSEDLGSDASLDGDPSGPGGGGAPLTTSRSGNRPVAGESPTTTAALGPQPPDSGLIPAGAGVRGVTDTTIEVGLVTADTEALNAVGSALNTGGDLAPETDFRKAAQAVVDYINSQGGVAGRRLVPRYYKANPVNATTQSGRDQEAQAACSAWTEDNQVFAMMVLGGGENLPCALATNTVLLNDLAVDAGIGISRSMFEQYHDIWYGPNLLLSERRDAALVEALVQQNFFTPGAKVAILTMDRPYIREGVRNAMRPTMARHGIEPALEIVYPDYINSPWQNYTLQLQSEGITHVVFAHSDAFPPFFMMSAAEDQQYVPRWGLASDNWPYGAAVLGAPRRQLAQTQGMGWMPERDTGDYTAQSANGELCLKLDRDNGQPRGTNGLYCNILLFLKFTLDRAPEVSPAGMSAALQAVGGEYKDAHTIGGATLLSPDRHDGASVQRDFVYDDRCTDSGVNCFKYTSPPRPLE